MVKLLLPTRLDAVRVYDRVASLYDDFGALWDRIAGGAATQAFRALSRRQIRSGALILDVGAGTGRSIALLLRESLPERVVGVDLSTGMLAQAKKKIADRRVVLVQADAMRLPFPDDIFDAVTSMWMMETLPDPKGAVGEFLRVLRPDGIVLVAFSALPAQPRQRIIAHLIELVMKPLFAGHFLPEQERPLHTCTMSCAHHYEYGSATVATFGKRCQLSPGLLPPGGLSDAT